MKLQTYDSTETAAQAIYLQKLPNPRKTTQIIQLLLKNKSTQNVADIMDIPFTTVAQVRFRFRELINLYLKSNSITLPPLF